MSEKAPLWYVEDHITGARQAAQELDREETIKRLEKALRLANGEDEYEPLYSKAVEQEA